LRQKSPCAAGVDKDECARAECARRPRALRPGSEPRSEALPGPVSAGVLLPEGNRPATRPGHGLKQVWPWRESVQRPPSCQREAQWSRFLVNRTRSMAGASYLFPSKARPLTLQSMSKKSAKIATLVASCQGRDLDARYLAYFECFNRGLYYEAH